MRKPAKVKGPPAPGMKRYRVYGRVTGTKYLGAVDAATAEAAEETALRTAYVSVCHACSPQINDPTIEEVEVEEMEPGEDAEGSSDD